MSRICSEFNLHSTYENQDFSRRTFHNLTTFMNESIFIMFSTMGCFDNMSSLRSFLERNL